MVLDPFEPAKLKLVQRARILMRERGFAAITMTEIAVHCGVTRRGLYHHFRDKEEVFRDMVRLGNLEAFEAGEWAAQKAMARGMSALDVVAEWLDTRFGNTRRNIVRGRHGEELNELAFRLCSEMMQEFSHESHARLGGVIAELCTRGLLKLRPGVSEQEAARLIADGARGVNQMRPRIPAGQIAARYRRIAEAILYGCAESSPDA
jgi:AcrR family transcriptional regulator